MSYSPRTNETVEPIARTGRIANAVLGGWLFLSAFLWEHSVEHMVSDALVGALAMSVALAALYVRPPLRVVNIALSMWLFASLAVLPGPSVATLFNDLFVATLLFGFAVIPPGRRRVSEHEQSDARDGSGGARRTAQ